MIDCSMFNPEDMVNGGAFIWQNIRFVVVLQW